MNSTHSKLLSIGIVCAAIAGSAGTAWAQGATQPCALLSQPQISSVIGANVDPGQPIGDTGCQWMAAKQPGARATIQLWDASAFGGMATPIPGVTKARVSGIGDDAFFATVGILTTLTVKKAKVTFVIRLYGVSGQEKQITMEKSLAADVLARM